MSGLKPRGIPADLRPRAARGPERVAWLAFLAVSLAGIAWGAHQPYSWDADNIAPGPVLRAIADGFRPGWHSSYGPVPYLLIAAAYLPLLALFRVTGELGQPSADFPWGLGHPDAAMAALIVAARLVSLALASLAVWTLARTAFPEGSPVRRRWTVPLLALGSPVLVYYARTSNVDMHYVAWLALGFFLLERPRAGAATLAGAAAAAVAAVCSKEQAAPLAVVILAGALLRAARWEAPRRIRGAAAVLAAALAAYAAAWMLPFNAAGWIAHHDFIFNVARYDRAYPLSAGGFVALGGRIAELMPVVFGWPALVALGAALLARATWRGLEWRAIGCGLYLAGFIGPVGYVYPRFLLPLLLLALPLAARGLGGLFVRAGAFPGLPAALGAALGLLALTGGPNLTAVQLTDPRLAVSRWLSELPEVTIEIVGNPRFQAPVPRGAAVIYSTFDSLSASPRGPRGDVVLLSSLDEAFFRRDPLIRSTFWDSLAGPGSPYRPPLWFRPPRGTGNVRNLFVSPTVQAYVRRDVPLAVGRGR